MSPHPPHPAIGTAAWAARTGGVVSCGDAVRLTSQLLMGGRRLPSEALARCGALGRLRPLSPPAPKPKNSAICDHAEELCRAASGSTPWLFGHSSRTYQFAQLFAQVWTPSETSHDDTRAYDDELLWVAAMTHDLGLIGPTTGPALSNRCGIGLDSNARCFAVRSASAACDLAASFGWSAERQERLATAVSIHINVDVPSSVSIEGSLINAGSALDVAGIRIRDIYSQQVIDILRTSPQPAEFRSTMRTTWRDEVRSHRRCRAGLLRWCGLPALICSSPLQRLP